MNEQLTAAIAALDAAHSQVMAALTTAGDSFDIGAVTAIRANAVGAIRIGNDMATLSKDAEVQAFAKNIVKVNTPVKDAAEAWLEKGAGTTDPPAEEPTSTTDPNADPNADPNVALAFFTGDIVVRAGAVLRGELKAKLENAKTEIQAVIDATNPAAPEEGKSAPAKTETVSKTVYEADMKNITKTLAEIKSSLGSPAPVKPKAKRLSEVLA